MLLSPAVVLLLLPPPPPRLARVTRGSTGDLLVLFVTALPRGLPLPLFFFLSLLVPLIPDRAAATAAAATISAGFIVFARNPLLPLPLPLPLPLLLDTSEAATRLLPPPARLVVELALLGPPTLGLLPGVLPRPVPLEFVAPFVFLSKFLSKKQKKKKRKKEKKKKRKKGEIGTFGRQRNRF